MPITSQEGTTLFNILTAGADNVNRALFARPLRDCRVWGGTSFSNCLPLAVGAQEYIAGNLVGFTKAGARVVIGHFEQSPVPPNSQASKAIDDFAKKVITDFSGGFKDHNKPDFHARVEYSTGTGTDFFDITAAQDINSRYAHIAPSSGSMWLDNARLLAINNELTTEGHPQFVFTPVLTSKQDVDRFVNNLIQLQRRLPFGKVTPSCNAGCKWCRN